MGSVHAFHDILWHYVIFHDIIISMTFMASVQLSMLVEIVIMAIEENPENAGKKVPVIPNR